MSRFTPREVALLMAREIDPQDDAPEDDEYIGEWVPDHSCGGVGDPTCAACWMHNYDDAVAREMPALIERSSFGTDAARIARASVSDEHARRLVERSMRCPTDDENGSAT